MTQTQKVRIPITPRPLQSVLLRQTSIYTVFTAVCHRRFGKTVNGVLWLILGALSGVPDYRGYYIAPNQKQAKRVVWHYFKNLLSDFVTLNLVKFNETELSIKFLLNGAQISLAGAENVEALRGIYIDQCVLDEMASWVGARYAFFEVIYPAMSDRNGKAFVIGTVKGLDVFHEFYMMGQDPTYPEFGSQIYPVTETGVFSDEQINTFRRIMTPDEFAREYMCDFYAEVPDVLITASELYAAIRRNIEDVSVKSYPEIWGLDVGYSNDPSSLCKRKGALMRPFTRMTQKDPLYQARYIRDSMQRENPHTVYVDAGYGEAVLSHLDQMGLSHKVIGVYFGSKSPKPNCFNMRSFMYNELKIWLPNGSIPDDSDFIKQASNQLLDDNDPDRRIKLKPKKDIKEVIGRSPDDSDSAALTFAGGGEDRLDANTIIGMADPDILTLRDLKDVYGIQEYNPDTHIDSLSNFSLDKTFYN